MNDIKKSLANKILKECYQNLTIESDYGSDYELIDFLLNIDNVTGVKIVNIKNTNHTIILIKSDLFSNYLHLRV